MGAAKEQTQPIYLTTGEVAAQLGMSRQSVLRWAIAGFIPGYRTPGGQWRFRPADVPGMIAKAHEAEAAAEAAS